MSINAIITGSTGMVGEGVLHECLRHPDLETVLVINRKTCGVSHPKLKEVLLEDFADLSSVIDKLEGYNAAYLCMGTTSFAVSEKVYSHITYDLTMAIAEPLSKLNPDMTLCYVSGLGTDSSENGRTMWTRVKGKTENALLKLPVKQAFMFRPGLIQPTQGLSNAYMVYNWINPLIPMLRKIFPKYITSLEEIGRAMIEVTRNGHDNPIIEVKDIVLLARK